MATKAKGRGPTAKVRGGSFINKSEMVREIGIDAKTLDRRIADGVFPPPHSRPGPRITLWRREHFRHYVDRGVWPPESFPSRGASDIQP
jgi:predicted DNA-binding transcriptional regulator AlpA